MKLSLSHHKTASRKKRLIDLNPRRYWIVLLSMFVLLLAGELAYFSYNFWKTNRSIDAPATPVLETNAGKINTMEESLNRVEAALRDRTGSVPGSSQNTSPVVQ